MFLGHMDYRWHGSRVHRSPRRGETALRNYREVEDFNPLSYSGGVGLSARLGGRTTLEANQNAAYSPSSLYGLFPAVDTNSLGAAVPVAPDYAISDSESYRYGSTVRLTRELSRRNRVSVAGEFRYTDFSA